MVNTNMHVFKHPKFYEEFRQRAKRCQKKLKASLEKKYGHGRANYINGPRVAGARSLPAKSDQVISNAEATAASERAPGQGQSAKLQAPSVKPQAQRASSLSLIHI